MAHGAAAQGGVPGAEELRFTPGQRAQRDALESAIAAHRERKASMSEEEYYPELEKLLLSLARFYEAELDRPAATEPSPTPASR
jgi:hypothetical protein